MPYLRRAILICLWASFVVRLSAAEPSAEGLAFFESRIRPVLTEKCYSCHSAQAEKVKGAFLLDTRAGLLKGGESGLPGLVPGDVAKSRLLEAIRYQNKELQMPPKEPLTVAQQKDFEAWVRMGAPDPRTAASGAAPTLVEGGIDFEKGRQFWSFQPVQKVSPPAVRQTERLRNPVDNFIVAGWEKRGLQAPAPADKRTLMRRATFDLTGLPPTPEEMDTFLADVTPDAIDTVVERLLASPAYGERWGRHWLDIVRYADTSGCNSDYPIPTAAKYRDYVIAAFNADKPYDQFIREQIAGDLLGGTNDEERFERIVATGYLAISRRFGSRASEFHLTIEDTIDNVSKAFLGLSVSCARCHDHKFDPISARDYYALYGIFNSTRYAFPGTEIYKHPKDFVPLTGEEEAQTYYEDATELAELDDRIEKLLEMKRSFERQEIKVVAKADADAGAQQVERKDQVRLPDLKTVVEVKAALEDARTRQRILENKTYTFEKAYAVAEGKPANARLHYKGDPRALRDEVPRGFLTVLGGSKVPAEEQGSGRRQLAQWLTSPANPLTARVMVNRIWQQHFGRGLVRSVNDFGVRGTGATHPELLDYLAAKFVESGWSIKAMHRLLMLSAAYQMSSAHHEANAALDNNNDAFWHFNRRRLTAEEVRDGMLALSGTMAPAPDEPHPFPPENEWKFTQHRPFVAEYESHSRSVYLMQQRIRRHSFLELFDGADPNAPTGDRPVSTTPLQALFMMNNAFAHEQADQLAVRVGLAQAETPRRIDYAYRLVYGRPATAEEVAMASTFLEECTEALNHTNLSADRRPRAALAGLMRVLLSSNEFLYLD